MKIDKQSGSYVFSKFEFWLLLFLLLFVALFVGYVSFVNAGSGSALTYVSFAATLISILLAVVAIGYTYGESVAERSKVDKISNEVSKLSDLSKRFEHQAEIFDGISLISDQIDSIVPKLEQAAYAQKTHDLIVELSPYNSQVSQSDVSSTDIDQRSVALCMTKPLANSQALYIISYLCILNAIIFPAGGPVMMRCIGKYHELYSSKKKFAQKIDQFTTIESGFILATYNLLASSNIVEVNSSGEISYNSEIVKSILIKCRDNMAPETFALHDEAKTRNLLSKLLSELDVS